MRTRGIFTIALLLCFIYSNSFSQDIIVKTNGEEIESKVVKITPELVEYYKFGKTDGPLYSIYRKEIFIIKYPDGSKDVFGDNHDDNSEKEEDNLVKNEIITDTFIDERDSTVYKIVKIGEQWWMGENLQYNTNQSLCYKKEESNCEECGRYYNFDEANYACPNGWHLPSDNEWNILEMEVGMSNIETGKYGWRGTHPGQAPELLSGGSSGLEIKFCGYIGSSLSYGYLNDAYYWTASVKSKKSGWIRHFKPRKSIERSIADKKYRQTVRCVKDSD